MPTQNVSDDFSVTQIARATMETHTTAPDFVSSQVGPIQKLCMGIEPAFYVDVGPPTSSLQPFFAFNPCGHMATEKTVK